MSFDLSTIAVREPAVLIRDPLGTPSYFWSQKEFQIKAGFQKKSADVRALVDASYLSK